MSEYTRWLRDIGGLSATSKLPCYSWSIPAYRCQTGSKLRNAKGSTCSKCYARKGQYVFPNVKDAMERRYAKLESALSDDWEWEKFTEAFVNVLQHHYLSTMGRVRNAQPIRRDGRFFRWHDSGDLQCIQHLDLIVEIARETPFVDHYLPTRERAIVQEYLKGAGDFPPNLTVRVSNWFIDKDFGEHIDGALQSAVHTDKPLPGYVACPATEGAGVCGICRMCWGKYYQGVSYKLH